MRLFVTVLAVVSTLAAESSATRKIAAVRVFGNPGQVGLFVADADGGNEHPLLASPSTDYDAVWAPDGSSIVFTSERDGSADLYRVKPDGSGLERLTADPAYDDQAAFSPDGKQLVFVSTRRGGTSLLWTMDLATHRPKVLTSGLSGDFRPSWSADGKWIAFSSSRGNTAPFAHGRWERLQITDIYIIHPDGSGLKKLTQSGNFCGSPKWMSDNQHVLAYCMTAEQTQANRVASPVSNDTRLVTIDATTGASTDVAAGPGVKMNPSPLPGNDVGYVRKDNADPGAGIYYTSGKRGPKGDVRSAAWSPDGKLVVFHKRLTPVRPAIQQTFSRNAGYELSLTSTILPAFSPTGDRFATNSRPLPNTILGASLMVTTLATGKAEVLHHEDKRNVLAPAWSPSGDKIIFSIGEFAAFFDGFRSLFLKPADRVETGAQVAIVNADVDGIPGTDLGKRQQRFPIVRTGWQAIRLPVFRQRRLRIAPDES